MGNLQNAFWVWIQKNPWGCYIKVANRSNHQFDCSEGKYHNDNAVVMYNAHNGGNQWFVVNPDRTISPTHSPKMVWGMKGNEMVLKPHGSKDQLVFKDLLPTHHNENTMKMMLRSHPGKGVCLTNKDK